MTLDRRQTARAGRVHSLILASALQNNLILATRDMADFLPSEVQVTNPWG